MDIKIGVIGKPSAGKSTFFNAVSDAKAKTGNYPFTTIEPNLGVSYYRTACPCLECGLKSKCRPRHGQCLENGTRLVPIKLMDVAGLIPGASKGAGLGNKFLDNLRTANALIHVIDISGRTNEKGEATEGYDPSRDAEWLQQEVQDWVFHNLWERWPSIARKHASTKATVLETFQAQLSGYSCNRDMIRRVLAAAGVKDPTDLHSWTEDDVREFVATFLRVRFPTVLLLNKADVGPAADKNIMKVMRRTDSDQCVVGSALAEVFLKGLRKQNQVYYPPGAVEVRLAVDFEADERTRRGLVDVDAKTASRIEKLQDMVFFRFGSTGVWDAVQRAADLCGPVVAYPVSSLSTFRASVDDEGVFGTAILVPAGTTMRSLAASVIPEFGARFLHAESVAGMQMGEGEPVSSSNNIVKFHLAAPSSTPAAEGGRH